MKSEAIMKFAVIALSTLLLMAAFAPTANATLITYFNFEDSTVGAAPDFTSDGLLSTTITTNYNIASMSSVAGLPLNVAAGDLDPNLLALGLNRTFLNSPADFNIPLFTSAGIDNMSLSFAISGSATGFTFATLWYSTDGGTTFINSGSSTALLSNATQLVNFAVPTAADNAPLLELRIELTGGQSNGVDIQNVVDNIQVNGTIVSAGVPDTGTTLGLLSLSVVALLGATRLRFLQLAA